MNQTYSIGNKHYEGTPVDKHIYIYTHVHMCIYIYICVYYVYVYPYKRETLIYICIFPSFFDFFDVTPKKLPTIA